MTRWLSFHTPYACRHAGVCCSSGWDIPLESARVAAIDDALNDGRIARVADPWLHPAPGAPSDVAGVLARTVEGQCLFHRDGCAVHHALGHAAMPAACQHFPRICLIDPRGVFVTLSHHCPTAALLLFESLLPPAIVDGPAPLPGGVPPEGLDARAALPPLLAPDVLMDHESYSAWEAHMIRRVGQAGQVGRLRGLIDDAIDSLYADAATLARWRPGRQPLLDVVLALARADAVGEPPPVRPDERSLFEAARAAVPAPHGWPDAPERLPDVCDRFIAPQWDAMAPIVGRYLAAHAFASWVAYQGTGIMSVVRAVHAALAVLRIESARICDAEQAALDADRLNRAIQRADLLLRHLIDPAAFAARLSA